MTALRGVPATGPADATRSALSGFIDYAGLFPPAALSMDRAVADYRAAGAGPDAWMLNRFLCPASRLGELAGVLTASPSDGMFRTRIVFDGDPAGDVARAQAFVAEVHPLAGFDMVEVKWAGTDLDELLDTLFELAYVLPAIEIDPRRAVEEAVGALAAARQARGKLVIAKLRCGGLTADSFPSAEEVAAFIGACNRAGLAFKATAGLHQPFRHVDHTTGFTRHGFVNLLAAAYLGRAHEADHATLTRIVDDRDPTHFELGRRVLRWQDLEVTSEDLSRLHWESMIGYGSCDFAEPVDALTTAGILPVPVLPTPPDDGTGPVY